MRKGLFGAIVVVNLLFAWWFAAGLSGTVYVSGCEALAGTAEARCVSGDPDYVVGCKSLGATSSKLYERCEDYGVPVHKYPGSFSGPALVFLWIVANFVLFAGVVIIEPERDGSPRLRISGRSSIPSSAMGT